MLRFTKLQDAMGARLLPAVLDYLPSVELLHSLRAMRNRFANDYPQDEVLRASYLNEVVHAVPHLVAVLTTIKPLVAGK